MLANRTGPLLLLGLLAVGLGGCSAMKPRTPCSACVSPTLEPWPAEPPAPLPSAAANRSAPPSARISVDTAVPACNHPWHAVGAASRDDTTVDVIEPMDEADGPILDSAETNPEVHADRPNKDPEPETLPPPSPTPPSGPALEQPGLTIPEPPPAGKDNVQDAPAAEAPRPPEGPPKTETPVPAPRAADWRDAYDAALAVAGDLAHARQDSRLSRQQREELVGAYSDLVVELLQQAVRQGFHDAGQLRREPVLTSLNSRADYQHLLSELDGAPR